MNHNLSASLEWTQVMLDDFERLPVSTQRRLARMGRRLRAEKAALEALMPEAEASNGQRPDIPDSNLTDGADG